MNDQELVDMALARGGKVTAVSADYLARFAPQPTAPPARGWKGRRRASGSTGTRPAHPTKNERGQNKTEARFEADILAGAKARGSILGYKFEYINFRVADQTTGITMHYRPDFAVWLPDRTVLLLEIKGFMRDGVREKYTLFINQYPMIPLYIVRAHKRSFTCERFGVRNPDPTPAWATW